MIFLEATEVPNTTPPTDSKNPHGNDSLPPSPNEEKSVQQPKREEQNPISSDKPIPLTERPAENLAYPPDTQPTKSVESRPIADQPAESVTEKQNNPSALPNSYFKPDSPSDPDPFATFPKDAIDGQNGQALPSPVETVTSAPTTKENANSQPGTSPKMSIEDFEAEEALFTR